MMRAVTLSLALAGLAACNTVPAYPPQPLVLPSGALGFSMAGVANYTTDQHKTEAEIRKVLEDACGGPIRFHRLEFNDPQTSIPMLGFDAVAECAE